MRFAFVLAAAAASLGGRTATTAPAVPVVAFASAEAEVRTAVAAFVSAFNALDQVRFDALWAEDATAFFPYPPFPIRRVDGRAAVLAQFKWFMDDRRTAGKSPSVDPKDLRVQLAGPDAAIVTFHLGSDPQSAARRTLIYRREPGGWRIVHLHASARTAS